MAMDPYKELLGIGPEEQPADAYRLLGLARYEGDDAMVRAAVERRIAGLNAESRAEFQEAATRLTHEVEAAGELLIDAEHRKVYDARLRDKVVRTNELAVAALADENGGKPAGSSSSRQPIIWVAVATGALLAMFVTARFLAKPDKPDPNKPSGGNGSQVAGSFQLVEIEEQRVAASDVMILSAQVKAKDDVKKQVRFSLGKGAPGGMTIDAKNGVIHWETKYSHAQQDFEIEVIASLGDQKDKRMFRVRVAPKNQPPIIADLEDQIVSPGGEFRLLVFAEDVDRDSITYSLRSAPSGMRIDPWTGLCFWRPGMTEAGKRHLVVVETKDSHGAKSEGEFNVRVIHLAPFRDKVNDRFADEVDAVDSPDDAAELARRVVKIAADNESEEGARLSSVQRYAMHLLALDLFFRSGDAELAVSEAERVGKQFGLESVEQQFVALIAVDNTTAADSEENSRKLAREAGRTMKLLLAADRLDDAIAMTDIAAKAARRAGEVKWEQVAMQRREQYEDLRPLWEDYRKSLAILEEDSDDRDARVAVGRWYAYVQGEWRRGLPLLTRRNFGRRKRLADRDLDTPEDPDEQFALAIAWWNFADENEGVVRDTVRGRAVYWYRMAEPDLSDDDLGDVPGELKALADEAAEADEKALLEAEEAAAKKQAEEKAAADAEEKQDAAEDNGE